MKKSIRFLFALILLAACNSKQETAPTAPSIDKDSVYTGTIQHPILDQLLEELDSTEVYDNNVIYGMWFEPHAAPHHIIFHKDQSFEYSTFEFPNDSDIIDITITGKFKVEGDSVYLWNDKGWKLSFRYSTVRKGEKMKYLTRDKGKDEAWAYFFVKGSD